MRCGLEARWDDWYEAAVVPRVRIVQQLPAAGVGLLVVSSSMNVALGLLPVAFIITTSAVIGAVPAALSGGLESAAFRGVVEQFLLAAAFFCGQQLLVPLRNAVGERIKRHVDGVVRDETLQIVLRTTGIGAMEDAQTADALSEVTRQFDLGWYTPGQACAGMLALVARYVRLCALLVMIAGVASVPVAAATGVAALLFRVGNRGGLRKFAAVWREVAGKLRRARYLAELGISGPAAKEIRVFGLVGFLRQRYTEAFFEVYDRVSLRRREIY
ncbi:MAG TPA: hypothetical protein VMG12_30050, partial [Polyangiaceae bacterium]|nr:hypothetical protein [Polyangiaceae bacterium]